MTAVSETIPLPRFMPLLNSFPREGTSTRTPNLELVHHHSREDAGTKLSRDFSKLWNKASNVSEVVLTMFAMTNDSGESEE